MTKLVNIREQYTTFDNDFNVVMISPKEYKVLLNEVVKNHEEDVRTEPNMAIPFTEDEMFVVEQFIVYPKMVATKAMELMKEFIG